MAQKTWTSDADFLESKGDFDGMNISGDKIVLQLKNGFAGRTWLDNADEPDGWFDNASAYITRGRWRVNFDSEGDAQNGWATLAWGSTEPDSSSIRLRARSAATEAALAGATWTDYYTESPVDNEADDGRWLQLEAELNEGSTPDLEDIAQDYGENC